MDAITAMTQSNALPFAAAAGEDTRQPRRIKAFIVHLARAREREAQVERLIAELPVDSEIVDAVDGRLLTPAEIASAYVRHLHGPRYPFRMTNSEIACFLSHRRAWMAIVEQGLDAGLVIEDDVALDPAFSKSFAAACASLAPGVFIRFPFRADRECGETILALDDATVIRPQRVGLGMVAQLVSREAATHLLRATATFDRPVDTTMQMRWVLGLAPLAVLPGGVREISSALGGSTITQAKTVGQRLSRELLRPLYRAKVALHSRFRG